MRSLGWTKRVRGTTHHLGASHQGGVVSVIGTTTRSFLLYEMKLNRVGISSLRIVNYFWTSRLLGKCAKLFQTQSVHQPVSQSFGQSISQMPRHCFPINLWFIPIAIHSWLWLWSGVWCLHRWPLFMICIKNRLAILFPTFTFCC